MSETDFENWQVAKVTGYPWGIISLFEPITSAGPWYYKENPFSLGPLSVRKRFWEQSITSHIISGCLSSWNPSASHVGPVGVFHPLKLSGTGNRWPLLLSPVTLVVWCGCPDSRKPRQLLPLSLSQFLKCLTASPAWISCLLIYIAGGMWLGLWGHLH